MKKRKKWIIIGAIALVVISVVAIGATRVNLNFGQQKKKNEDKQEVVRRGKFVVRVRESGTLRSFIEVDVRSNVEGEILKIFVEESDIVEIGQPLLQIDEKQILEQMKQAEANRDARKAQLQQAELQIQITEKQQESSLVQATNSVSKAKATVDSLIATTQQRITEAETLVATTQNSLNQDKISLKQAEIALVRAKLTLERTTVNVESAKITLETAESEYNRNKELFDKKLVSKQTLEESRKQLVVATSQYETAQNEAASQQETIKSQAENTKAMEEAIRSREATLELHKRNVHTLQESEDARRKQLVAELENARTHLQQLEQTTEEEKELTRHAKVSAAANLLQAESQLKSQQERYEWTTVRAPMSGTITHLIVEEGEIITSGRSAFSRGEAIMRIADLSQMIVRTQINQVEIGKIAVGQRAEISVDSYPDRVFEGRVSDMSPSATQQSQNPNAVITFEVDVEVIGSPPELLPGMSADVDIIVFEESDILQLPIAAVLNPKVVTVKASLSSDELGQFQQGQELKIRNPIGKEFSGRVGQVLPDRSRGNLEILLEGMQEGLRTGPTEIGIVISDNKELTGIEAEIDVKREFFVRLNTGEPQKKEKSAERGVKTHIEVGQRNNTHFQITGGLKEGDRVFVPSMMELTKDTEPEDDE